MCADPLIRALHDRRLLTPADLDEAIRYREAELVELTAALRMLRRLRETWDLSEAIRLERDPPIEASEHSHH